MNASSTGTVHFLRLRQAVILVLAGILIFYHVSTLNDMYLGASVVDYSAIVHTQSFIRAMISISLSLLLLGRKAAIWWMWLSISALIATQYVVHYGSNPPEFTLSRTGFSYLRGFIFPTIISLVYPYTLTKKQPLL